MAGYVYREKISERVADTIETHHGFPFSSHSSLITRSFNPVSGTVYRGCNTINLAMAAMDKDFDDPRWMTLKQANSLGYSVKKGSEAVRIEFWDWTEPEPTIDESGNVLPADEDAVRSAKVYYSAVFNGRDIEGIPPLNLDHSEEQIERNCETVGSLFDKVTEAKGFKVVEKEFSRRDGEIVQNEIYIEESSLIVPDFSQMDPQEVAALKIKGLTLICGESPEPNSSKATLRSQIATDFLIAQLGLEANINQERDYLGWYDLVLADKNEIFRAAKDADRTVEAILEFAPELKSEFAVQIVMNQLEAKVKEPYVGGGLLVDLSAFVPKDVKKVEEIKEQGQEPAVEDRLWNDLYGKLREKAKESDLELVLAGMMDKNDDYSTIKKGFINTLSQQSDPEQYYQEKSDMLVKVLFSEVKQVDSLQKIWTNYCDLAFKAVENNPAIDNGQLNQALTNQFNDKYRPFINQSILSSRSTGELEKLAHEIFTAGNKYQLTTEPVKFCEELIKNYPAQSVSNSSEAVVDEKKPDPMVGESVLISSSDPLEGVKDTALHQNEEEQPELTL